MRSYSGCLTCRKRKLKCDEEKPQCGHCRKSSRECIFTERDIFRRFDSHGPTGSDGLFEEGQVWLEVPRELIFIQIEDPYCCEDEPSPPDHTFERLQESPFTELDYNETQILDSVDIASVRDEQSDSPPNEERSYSPSDRNSPDYQARNNIIVMRCLNHFKQGPGQWMDVFDTGAYFSHKIPVLATSRPLLKSAVCATAAKHLRHIENSSNEMRFSHYQHPNRPVGPSDDVDWHYQSTKHYYEAINQLKDSIRLRQFETDSIQREEVFAAIAILCTYELMDAPGTAWRAHLSALPLFNSAPEPGASPYSPVTIPRTAITGPIFWSLARQDLLCAFVSETQTRFDLDDIRLWQNAGLITDATGRLVCFSPSCSGDIRTSADVEEDTRSNEIHWILGKIANFITSGDALHPADYALPREDRPSIGVTQERLLERWTILTTELQQWRRSLSKNFEPAARTKVMNHDDDLADFEQIWYQLPICAAAMQSYHMACILLLVNEPQEATAIRSTVTFRLQSYRRSEREAIRHARELCGISLANPSDANRIHSVQPLYVAGQVFEHYQDVKVVLELLEGIEGDLGWTTSHHVSALKELPATGGVETTASVFV